MCRCVCVCACVRACVHACVHVCVCVGAQVRMLIAQVLSTEMDASDSDVSPYTPSFYQAVSKCPQAEVNPGLFSVIIIFFKLSCSPPPCLPPLQNMLMQQPLCHLYFITLLEHLTSVSRDISDLVIVAGTISRVGGRKRERRREIQITCYTMLCLTHVPSFSCVNHPPLLLRRR